MKDINVRFIPFCLSAYILLAVTSNAQAQTNESTQGTAPEAAQIIVTANKRTDPIGSVPASISVLTAKEIEQSHVRDLMDATDLLPGLRIEQEQASTQTNFFIRGFGNGDNNVGIEPSVGVFIDGVYRSRTASQISDLPDVEQIEVMKGPQTTLFGKNASAGAVAITTQPPQFTHSDSIELSYGNFDASTIKARVTGPLTKNLAFSLSGSFDRDDGYVTNLFDDHKINNRNRWSLRGQLLWLPIENVRVRLIADVDPINERCCAVFNILPSPATQLITAIGGSVNSGSQVQSNSLYNNFNPQNDIRNHGISGQINVDGDHLHVISISALRNLRSVSNQDADFTSADLLGVYSEDLHIRTITQELRLESKFNGPFNFMAGVYYFNENVRQSNDISWGSDMLNYADGLIQSLSSQMGQPTTLANVEGELSALTGQNLAGQFFGAGQGQSQSYGIQDRSISTFLEAELKPVKNLTVTAGLNFTRDVKHFQTSITSTDVFSNLDLPDIANGAISAGVPANQAIGLLALMPLQLMPSIVGVPNPVEPGKTADTNVSWTARADYEAKANVHIYGNISTGFKPSSINLCRDSRPSITDAPALTAAGLSLPPTINVAGLAINTGMYGSRYSAPETSTLFEGGVRAIWRHANLSLSMFKEIVRDFQSIVFTGTGFFLQNAGQESNWGLEASSTVKPTKHLALSGSVAWYNPHYDSFENSSVGDLTRTRPANIPPYTLTLSAEHDLQLPHDQHLRTKIVWHYEGSTKIIEGLPAEVVRDPITQQVITDQPAIDLANNYKRVVSQIDGSISYEVTDRLTFSVWGRNITNKRYLVGVVDSPAQSGSLSGYYNRPRTYGLSASARW